MTPVCSHIRGVYRNDVFLCVFVHLLRFFDYRIQDSVIKREDSTRSDRLRLAIHNHRQGMD